MDISCLTSTILYPHFKNPILMTTRHFSKENMNNSYINRRGSIKKWSLLTTWLAWTVLRFSFTRWYFAYFYYMFSADLNHETSLCLFGSVSNRMIFDTDPCYVSKEIGAIIFCSSFSFSAQSEWRENSLQLSDLYL